jgi:hypothetical protein
MGKASRRPPQQTPPAPPPKARGKTPLAIGALLVAGAALAGLVMMNGRTESPASPEVAAATTPAPGAAHSAPGDEAPAIALQPHPQKDLPPLQLPAYPLGRSPAVITAAYRFAAEHPEILSYVPCFCGCERSGHRGNEDCFVRSRDSNGDVREWEEHGMECNVCLDVAQQAMQMYASGASVRDIRAAVEAKWTPQATTHTPTPHPPK